MTPAPRWRARLLGAAVGVVVVGCAFLESATEVTLGADAFGEIDEEARLSVERVGAALDGPTLSADASWHDLRAALCQGSTPELSFVESPRSANLRGFAFTIGLAGDGDLPCDERPLALEFTAELLPFTSDQLEDLHRKLPTDPEALSDSIRQVRLRFYSLGLASGSETVNHQVNAFGTTLADAHATPPLDLVPLELLSAIDPATPQRFELDPHANLTKRLVDSIVTSAEHPLTLTQRVEVVGDALRALPVHDSGLVIRCEIEVVVAALDALL